MSRPCEGEHEPQYKKGEPYQRATKFCRPCWLYVNDESYRRIWDDPAAGLGGKPHEQGVPLDDEPCAHLGEPTGETVSCKGCRGHVELKLYKCGVYGECTLGKTVEGTACCRTVGGCPGRSARPREGQGEQARAKARRAGKRGFSWAYGVTTVPSRRDNLLPRTLESLAAAGFDKPRLFVDGAENSEAIWWERQYALEVVVRTPRDRTRQRRQNSSFPPWGLGTFGNWILALAEMYIRQPDADRYALFQDDLIAVANLRAYLESCPYPDGQDGRPKGYENLLTFPQYQDVAPKNERGGTIEGWFHPSRVDVRGLGAVALVFNREAATRLMTSYEHIIDRPLTSGPRAFTNLDGAVHDALRKQGWREFCHSPSLVRHTGQDGHHSTMGHQPFPVDVSFPGEGFDAVQLAGKATGF